MGAACCAKCCQCCPRWLCPCCVPRKKRGLYGDFDDGSQFGSTYNDRYDENQELLGYDDVFPAPLGSNLASQRPMTGSLKYTEAQATKAQSVENAALVSAFGTTKERKTRSILLGEASKGVDNKMGVANYALMLGLVIAFVLTAVAIYYMVTCAISDSFQIYSTISKYCGYPAVSSWTVAVVLCVICIFCLLFVECSGCFASTQRDEHGASAAHGYTGCACCCGLILVVLCSTMAVLSTKSKPYVIQQGNEICRIYDAYPNGLPMCTNLPTPAPQPTPQPTPAPVVQAKKASDVVFEPSTDIDTIQVPTSPPPAPGPPAPPIGQAPLPTDIDPDDEQANHRLLAEQEVPDDRPSMKYISDVNDEASCATTDELCSSFPDGWNPLTACECAGGHISNSLQGSIGAYCSKWQNAADEWCLVSDAVDPTSCPEMTDFNSMRGSTGPCSAEVESRSQMLSDGVDEWQWALIWPFAAGVALLLSACCSCALAQSLKGEKPKVRSLKSPSLDKSMKGAALTTGNTDISMLPLEEQFRWAQEQASLNTTDATPEIKRLEIYGFYHQAVQGNIQGDRPSLWHKKEVDKYDAWKRLEGLGRNEAMRSYVAAVQRLPPAPGVNQDPHWDTPHAQGSPYAKAAE